MRTEAPEGLYLINCEQIGSNKSHKAKKKYMCVYCHMSKKSRVGINFFFIIGKTRNSRSRFRNPIPVFHFRNFR